VTLAHESDYCVVADFGRRAQNPIRPTRITAEKSAELSAARATGFMCSRSVGNQTVSVIEQLVQRAVQHDLIVPGLRIGNFRGNLLVDGSRTVPGQGVVPFGPIFQPIQVVNVSKEYGPGRINRHAGAIKVDFLTGAVVGAQADDIPFVGGDEDQFVLPEKTE